MNCFRFAPVTFGLALYFFANTSFAQYVWIDEKGVKQFSDMPPPTNVPASHILKQPSGTLSKSTTTSDADQPGETAKPASAQTKGPMTTAEQNAEFKKRRAEQTEKEKKATEQAKHDADKAANCDRARSYLRSLETGERIARTDTNGERTYLSDEQKNHELQETRRYLADCK